MTNQKNGIELWLWIVFFMIYIMTTLGGITRLTRSGLSITEWRPITGILPPLNANDWQLEFEKYKATPEYRKVNRGMSLGAFQWIFFWEYFHRLWGRLIGFASIFPFIYFLIRRKLPASLAYRTALMILFGGAQGALGWYMVKSGLIDMPRVSHYRLAAHLSLALLIMAYVLYIIRWLRSKAAATARAESTVISEKQEAAMRSRQPFAIAFAILVFFQIIYGAFTAGIRAGYMYNTFPLMGSSIMPGTISTFSPWLINFIENPAMIQFVHRLLAWSLLGFAFYIFASGMKRNLPVSVKKNERNIFVAIIVQFALGIFTIVYAVPISIGVLHQIGAVAVFSFVAYYVIGFFGPFSFSDPFHEKGEPNL